MIESATATDDDDDKVDVAAKAAASEGVTSMTVRVTIVPKIRSSLDSNRGAESAVRYIRLTTLYRSDRYI